MAEALFEIAEPGESRGKQACRTRAVGHRSRDHQLAGRDRATRAAGLPAPTSEGEAIVPSVVHYAGDGSVVVGAEARDRLAPDFPRDTIASVKRFMGRGPARRRGDAQADAVPVRARDGRRIGRWCAFAVAGGRAVTPMEVSAEILQGAAARAEEALGGRSRAR